MTESKPAKADTEGGADAGNAADVGAAGAGNFVARLTGALFGASASGLALAFLDAHWIAAADGVVFSEALLPVAGLLAPLGLLVGALVGGMSLMLHPWVPPSWAGLKQTLALRSPAERSVIAWVLLLAGPAVFLWVWVNAKLSLSWLVTELSATRVGLGMGVGVVGSALALALAVRGVAGVLAARFPSVRPPTMLLAGAASFAALVGVAVLLGTTSGTGGVLAIFGVFKRPELDLRASGMLLALIAAAYLAPAFLRRLRPTITAALAFLPLTLLLVAEGALEARALSLGVERSSALSKRLLPLYRSLTDADGDGFSRAFGGGDCNDNDSSINPAADDIPGNGVDEDCSGSDARKLELDKPVDDTPKDADEWMAEKLDKKFNVLLVTIDTLRFDLGYMGYERPVSPNMDRLAERSTVFENAYALASYTAKSLPPMLIGKYTSETHRGWAHFNRFSKEDWFVQERLEKAGIHTISVQGYWYFFHKGYGFERGFDVIDSTAAPKVVQIEGDKSSNSDELSDAAIAQLSRDELDEQQFFMWVHYIDPHSEYAPHEGFDFGTDSRARYDGEVAYVDHHLGRVLEALEKQSFSERTVVILTSDHGEAFGEHGMIRHGFELWEELVRVPLIFHIPGAEPHRVSERRSIIDIVPSILELYKIPSPSNEGADFVSGRSLLEDVLMPPGHQPQERIVFVDMSAGPHNAERQAFIENDIKLTASQGRTLGIYDLDKDASEQNDLSDDEQLAERIGERFKAFRRELRVVPVKPQ